MGRRKIQLVAGHHYRYLLEVGPLLPDLLEALLDAVEGRRRGDRVHQEEGVGRGYAQPPHRRELHVAGRVQDVHLEGGVAEVVLSVVEVFHCAPRGINGVFR